MVSAMMMADTLSPTPQLSTFNSPDEDDFCTQPPHQQHNEEMVFVSASLAEMDQSFSDTSAASNHQTTAAIRQTT